MSSPTRNAPHSKSQSPSSLSPSTPPDLAALAEKFQEATQALLAFCRAGMADEDTAPDDAALPDDKDESAGDQGEIRSYYFSPFALESERKLLKEYEAEDFRGLLLDVHLSLAGMVELMKNIEMDAKLNSIVIYSLGCLLERVSSLVFRMQDAYSIMEPVKA